MPEHRLHFEVDTDRRHKSRRKRVVGVTEQETGTKRNRFLHIKVAYLACDLSEKMEIAVMLLLKKTIPYNTLRTQIKPRYMMHVLQPVNNCTFCHVKLALKNCFLVGTNTAFFAYFHLYEYTKLTL